ncbi:hypothetical protein [Candidatus Parabeggiatoa sp. HSG14]|uniref:hypothetical protein n=1 Tax=Candidatus Parabeggiatoa sp. HSG14 TaxID=3055593 RepID=UPI0025A8E8AD|nr:hypothetical protein [Thiotrichales bacterium HSG14]
MSFKEILLTAIVALIIGIFLVHYENLMDDESPSSETVQIDTFPLSQPPQVPQTPSATEATATLRPISPAPDEEISPVPTVVKPPKTEKVSPIITQLKELQIFNASIAVTFWLDVQGKTQFSTNDKLTLYYQIADAETLVNEGAFYFTLFNISPKGKLAILINNEKVEIGKRYSLPKSQQEWQTGQISRKDKRLRLEAGREYFKAIVTNTPITSWLKFLATDTKNKLQRQKLLSAKKLWIKVISEK